MDVWLCSILYTIICLNVITLVIVVVVYIFCICSILIWLNRNLLIYTRMCCSIIFDVYNVMCCVYAYICSRLFDYSKIQNNYNNKGFKIIGVINLVFNYYYYFDYMHIWMWNKIAYKYVYWNICIAKYNIKRNTYEYIM